jgi:hypothetical protein
MTHRPARPPAPFDIDRLIRERLRLESVLVYLNVPARGHAAEIVVKVGGLCGRVAFMADSTGMRLRVEWGSEHPLDEADLERRFSEAAGAVGLAFSLIESAEGAVILWTEQAFADGYDLVELADWFAKGGTAAQRMFDEPAGDGLWDFAEIPESIRKERASGNLARPACQPALRAQARLLEAVACEENAEIRVALAYEPDGFFVFCLTVSGTMLYIRVLPSDERSYEVSCKAVLGRVHSDYLRALRWLAGNRDSESVMVSVSPKDIAERVLSIGFCRLTAEGDPIDILDQLKPAMLEVERTMLALPVWFPHLAFGSVLHKAKGLAEVGDQSALFEMDLFYHPDDLLKEVPEADKGLESDAYWIAWAARNAGRRDEETRWLEEGRKRLAAEESDEVKRELGDFDYRLSAARALAAGRRFEEALALAEELIPSTAGGYEGTHARLVLLESLVGLGRFTEAETLALDWQAEIQASGEGDNPRGSDDKPTEPWHRDAGRLHLWHCLAVAGLGRREEAEHLLEEWEMHGGIDIAAREEVDKLLANSDAE